MPVHQFGKHIVGRGIVAQAVAAVAPHCRRVGIDAESRFLQRAVEDGATVRIFYESEEQFSETKNVLIRSGVNTNVFFRLRRDEETTDGGESESEEE